MTDLDYLLAAVIMSPDDDTVRLAFADALDERGGPRDRDRAWYIRWAFRLTGGADRPGTGAEDTYWWTDWLGLFDLEPFFDRGFVLEVAADAANFLRAADKLLWHPGQNRPCPPTAHPVRKVVLTDRPAYSWQAGWANSGWPARVTLRAPSDETLHARVGPFARCSSAEDVLAALWPGVEFGLPPAGTTGYGHTDFTPLFAVGGAD